MNPKRIPKPRFMEIGEAADRLGVHPATIRLWERQGRIPPIRRRNGRRIFSEADIKQIMSLVMEGPNAAHRD